MTSRTTTSSASAPPRQPPASTRSTSEPPAAAPSTSTPAANTGSTTTPRNRTHQRRIPLQIDLCFGNLARGSAQNRICDLPPIGLIRDNRVHHESLRNDERWKRVLVHDVDLPIDDPISHRPEENQRVYTSIEKCGRKNMLRKSPPTCGRQRA